jgi:hypothetical protein
VCLQMQQQLPQQQHAGPQVEEVPQHAHQRGSRGGGPIVEEPDEGTYCLQLPRSVVVRKLHGAEITLKTSLCCR